MAYKLLCCKIFEMKSSEKRIKNTEVENSVPVYLVSSFHPPGMLPHSQTFADVFYATMAKTFESFSIVIVIPSNMVLYCCHRKRSSTVTGSVSTPEGFG